MSSYSKVTMTEEQELLLKSLEEEFKDRYTEKDENYNAVLNVETYPPLYENWIAPLRDESRRWNNSYRRDRYYNDNERHYYDKEVHPSSYGPVYPHQRHRHYSQKYTPY